MEPFTNVAERLAPLGDDKLQSMSEGTVFDINPEVVEAVPGRWYRMWVRFADGAEGELDLSDLVGTEGFSAWKSKRFFRSVQIEDGALVWGDREIGLCSDVLYHWVTDTPLEEIFQMPPETDKPVVVMDEGEDKIYVEYTNGTRGAIMVSDNMKTGRCFPLAKRESDGKSSVAPWGDILWGGDIELNSSLVKAALGASVDASARSDGAG